MRDGFDGLEGISRRCCLMLQHNAFLRLQVRDSKSCLDWLHLLAQSWLIGWVHETPLHWVPVDPLKELVLHYRFDVQSDFWVRHQDALHQVPRHRRQVLGQNQPTGWCHFNDLIRRHGLALIKVHSSDFHGFWAKRCESTEHLAHQDAKTPYISFVGIASAD